MSTMGLGGLFLWTAEPPPVSTIIKLFFQLLGGIKGARVRAEHETLRVNGGRIHGDRLRSSRPLQQVLKRVLG